MHKMYLCVQLAYVSLYSQYTLSVLEVYAYVCGENMTVFVC